MTLITRLVVVSRPDCMTYACKDDCCGSGCDVWPHERAALIRAGLATESDFVDPYFVAEGDGLYRTAIGPRGCIFLKPDRGCKLHDTGLKPDICVTAWSSPEAVEAMRSEGLLPCHAEWSFR